MQKVGPTNYMIEVEEHVCYVHIDHLQQRDSRSMSGGLPTPEQTDIPIAPTSSKELIPPVISVTQESDAVETPGRVNASREERTPTTTEENGQVRPTLQPVPTGQVE